MDDTISQRYHKISDEVASIATSVGRSQNSVTLIAVSKTHSVEVVEEAINSGITTFGESYTNELCEKHEYLTSLHITPIWHFIGHLQTNKVKYIAPFVSVIHSVDSFKLAHEISAQAFKNNRIIDICIQVNTSGEISKFGCNHININELTGKILSLSSIRLIGLMTIPSFTASEENLRKEFSFLRRLRDELKINFPLETIDHLSMGMSGDYKIAIEEGATMVRIGTAIFGERYYPLL